MRSAPRHDEGIEGLVADEQIPHVVHGGAQRRSERRLLAVLLVTAALGAFVSLAFLIALDLGGPVERIAMATVAPVLLGLALAVAQNRVSVRVANRVLAAGLATGLLVLQAEMLLAETTPGGVAGALHFLPALAPFVYLLAFQGWEAEVALITSGAFLAVASALPVMLVAFDAVPSPGSRPLLTFFLSFSVAHSVLVGLVLVFARHRREAEHARQTIGELGLLVRTDALTGALNRRGLVEQLWIEAERNTSRECRLALIFVDLDHFKRVNDRWGHPAGDQVLKAFSDVLLKLVRTSDVVGRWGGEEFVVLMRRPTSGEALFMADRLRRYVQDFNFPVVGNLTASFGVAELGPGETVTEVISAADEALYRAKAQGRNRTCASRDMMDEMAVTQRRTAKT